MTKQEIYDTVCKGLAEQGGPSIRCNESGMRTACLYRGPGGRKCAAGLLIPDDLYRPDMDTATYTSFRRVVERYPELRELIGVDNLKLVQSLQDAHDERSVPSPSMTLMDPEEIVNALHQVALRYGITPGAEQAITKWEVYAEPTEGK